MKPTTRRGNPATVAAWTSFDWLNWGQMNEGERRLREAIAEVGRAGSRSSRSSRSVLRCLFEAAADRPPESPAEPRVHLDELLARPRAVSLVAGLERARLRFLEAIRSPADLTLNLP